MLAIQILTKNSEKTLEKCLKSLESINAKVIVADLGSQDSTLEIIKSFRLKPEIFDIDDCAKIRNLLATKYESAWNLYLHAHESIVGGHEEINQINSSNLHDTSFYFKIIQGTVITNEVRLWNKKLRFVNPIFETIKDNHANPTKSCIILSQQQEINVDYKLKAIEKWKMMEPASFDPYYYQALALLLNNRYAEFTGIAKYYLFKEKPSMATTMLRYYLAMCQIYLKEYNEATKNILHCISDKPIMAEFWCLLGDVYYHLKNYHKCIFFYENAIVLGSRRLQSDRWPMDVSKYKEHPMKMIESSNKIISETKFYAAQKDT